MPSMRILRTAWLCALASLGFPLIATAQVALHYNERPPYLLTANGQLTGLTGAPVVAAFKAAGIPYVLNATPSARQMAVIRENSGLDCAIGWFKNEEREKFARFTRPIYQDRPPIALTAARNSRNASLKNGDALENVLGNRNLVLLVKVGYSYGRILDAMIERHQPIRTSVSVENMQMLRMIHAGHADYMFIAPEEAEGLIRASGIDPAEIRGIAFADAPKGENRHIMCSMKVPDEIVGRLNSAIN